MATCVGDVSRVVHHLRESDQGTERAPQLVAADADRDVARFGVKRLVGQQRAVRGPERARHDAIGQIGADHAGQDPQLAFEHRYVDELAASGLLARVERGENPERRIHAGGDVGDRHAGADATAAWLAGDANHAALGLHHEIERRAIAIGSVLAEAGNRTVDDARLAFTHRRVVETELGNRANTKVFEHDIRTLEQPEKQRPALRVLQIERETFLVAVQIDEVSGLVAIEGRSPRSRDFTAGRLDLDDLRAIVAEHRRGERAGERVGEIENGNVRESRHSR